MQQWLASARLAEARLVVVTRGGVAVGAEAPDLAQAPVWGLVRSAQSEHPGRFVLVDVDAASGEPHARAGLGRGRRAWTSRSWRCGTARCWRRGSPDPAAGRAGRPVAAGGRAEGLPGGPGDRRLRRRPAAGAGEVRVGVRAAGLNFRDVLIALGMYPGDAPLGSEARRRGARGRAPASTTSLRVTG